MSADKNWSFVMAKRLKQLRESRGLSHEKLSAALKEKYAISISSESLMNYEVSGEFHSKRYKNMGMRVEYLRYFSDFYEVSTDYLLGLTDIRSNNEDVKEVCRVTGLKEDFLYNLMGVEDRKNVSYLRDMVNDFLSFAVNEGSINTYMAFRKYIDMDDQAKFDYRSMNREEYERRYQEMLRFAAAARENGYLIMSCNQAAENELNNLVKDYGEFLVKRYRHFDEDVIPERESLIVNM